MSPFRRNKPRNPVSPRLFLTGPTTTNPQTPTARPWGPINIVISGHSLQLTMPRLCQEKIGTQTGMVRLPQCSAPPTDPWTSLHTSYTHQHPSRYSYPDIDRHPNLERIPQHTGTPNTQMHKHTQHRDGPTSPTKPDSLVPSPPPAAAGK